jgi:hypothetical protein
MSNDERRLKNEEVEIRETYEFHITKIKSRLPAAVGFLPLGSCFSLMSNDERRVQNIEWG